MRQRIKKKTAIAVGITIDKKISVVLTELLTFFKHFPRQLHQTRLGLVRVTFADPQACTFLHKHVPIQKIEKAESCRLLW